MNDEKAEVVDGITYRYSSSWIHKLEAENHWRLYWHQQRLMEGRVHPAQSVLEIGVRSGLTANYLRPKGVNVTTLDIDADKKPDIVASIVTFDFDNVYNHVLAFDSFEHIPFDKFIGVAEKLSTACREYLFMSVPHCERILLMLAYIIPKVGHGKIGLATRRKKITGPHHYWEVDQGQGTREQIERITSNAGFRQVQRYKVLSRTFSRLRK